MKINRSNQRRILDESLKKLVSNSYDSLRVSGRGTIYIDPKEVFNSAEHKAALAKAKEIVLG